LRVIEDLLAVTVHRRAQSDSKHTWWCYDIRRGIKLGEIKCAMPLLVIPRTDPFSMVTWNKNKRSLRLFNVTGRIYEKQLTFLEPQGVAVSTRSTDLETILNRTVVITASYVAPVEGSRQAWVLCNVTDFSMDVIPVPYRSTSGDWVGSKKSTLVTLNSECEIVFVDFSRPTNEKRASFASTKVATLVAPKSLVHYSIEVWRDVITSEEDHGCQFYRPHIK